MDKRTNTFNMVIILSIVVMATYAQQVRLRRPIGSIVGMFLGRFNPRRGPDRGGLQRTLESLRGYQDRGISLVQLRRRSRLIDSVIRWMEERNREDPVNPDGTQRSVAITTFAQAFCELCRRLNHWACISRYCF